MLEKQFGDWLTQKYGSLDAALAAVEGPEGRRATRPAEGRMGFRPLWNMFNEKTPRDQDTARVPAGDPDAVLRRDARSSSASWASRA